MEILKADAVFEGGGVRGIAFAGAVEEAEKRGYQWHNIAGTSAGAIVAALLAADYKAKDIEEIMLGMDFKELKDTGWEDEFSKRLLFLLRYLPRIGEYTPYALSIFKDLGIFEGKRFQELMESHLAKKKIYTYKDLVLDEYKDEREYRYRLRVIASDLTTGEMLVLPDDIEKFGMEPDELSVALSVRMSMSIPIFFEPVQLYNKKTKQKHTIVDGGILSNYPIWLFDTPAGEVPAWPTFGFNLYEPNPDEDKRPDPLREKPKEIKDPIGMVSAIWNSMFSATDRRYVSKRHWARTIPICTLGVKTTEFALDDNMKQRLLDSGREGARAFFETWNFEEYIKKWISPDY
jgi:NTE family protein